jgi:hypothetical protein
MKVIHTIKLDGPQLKLVSTLVREAAELADFRSRDTTPAQQANYEAEHAALKELLAEIEVRSTHT